MAISSCIKCGGHSFELALFAPIAERGKLVMIQCSTCGTPVCALDSTTGPQIEALKSHIAAIDEKLSESHKLYRNETKQDGAMRWALFALGFFVTLAAPALSNDLIGNASIIDGDTLEIHGSRIRLWGIDAPESTQLCRGSDSLQYRCGARAANDLDAFIAKRPVSCTPISLDQYGRTVATCSVNGADLGEWLVRSGLALDWPQYSKRKYDAAQRDAEHAGRGMWAGSYVEPWLYRACIRQGGRPTDCSDDANAHP